MHFLLTKYCIWPRRILFLPKVFQKVRKLRQILISRQNSVYKGLSFSSKSKLFGEGPLCLRTTFATLVSTIPDGSSLMTRGEWTLRLRHIHRWKLMYTWYTWRLCLSHIEVDLDQVNPQEVLAEVPAQHLLWLLAKQLRLPTAGVQARLTLVNIFFFPCSSLWLSLSLSLYNSFSDCPSNGLCCFDGCSDRCLESSQQGRITELFSNFLPFCQSTEERITSHLFSSTRGSVCASSCCGGSLRT